MQNKSLILNVVLAIVALVLGVRLATGTKPVEKTESGARNHRNSHQHPRL